MASKVTSNTIPIYADGDALLHPLRVQLQTIAEEITALQEGGGSGGGARQAFWFSNLSGAIAGDDAWHPITMTGGGMTGDSSVATADANGLTLLVEAVAQVKVWIEFASEGTGAEQVGVSLEEGGNTRYRGQLQMNTGETMLAAMYDGWLRAGVVIGAAARSTAVASINAASYVTVVVTPTGG